MRKLVFLLFSFFIIGCSTHQQVVVKPKPLPNWYLNPPKSNQNVVYVTGSGITKKEAILNALSNFIARLSVTISSKFESKKFDFGGGLASSNASYNIKAIVKKFEISNYEIVKAEQYKFDQFLVLIKVDMKKLFKNLKNKLDDKFANYQSKYKIILKEDPLNQLLDLEDLYSNLIKEKSYIYTLKIMNNNFNEKKYINFINSVSQKLNKLKSNFYVDIICKNPYVAEDIKKYLTQHGIKIGKSSIKLIVNIRKRKSNYMNLNVYEIFINTKYKNETISSNYFKIIIPSKVSISGYLYSEIKKLSLRDFFNIKN